MINIAPGQILESPRGTPPVVRVVCRYPFDAPGAQPRWIVEHINQPTHEVEIVAEKRLISYELLVSIPLAVALDGSS